MALTREALVAYISDEFGVGAGELSDGSPLFSSGVLDSFSLVDIVTFMEKEAGIKINALEVSLDNLDTVDRMMVFVERKVSAKG